MIRSTFVTLFLLTVTTSAAAQSGENARSRAMARALFDEGVAFGEQERWGDAVDRFRRAYELHASPGIAVNLASALIPLGQLVEASEILQSILDQPSAPAQVTDLARTLLHDEVEPNLARLTIHVEGDSHDVTVDLDGVAVPSAAFDVALPANPGQSVVSARRDGEVVVERALEIEPGGNAEVTLAVPTVPTARETAERAADDGDASPMAPVPEEESGGIATKWWFWTGLVVIVAAATAVALTFALSGEEVAAPVQGTTNPPYLEGVVMP